MENTVLDAIMKRRTIRAFKPEQLDKTQLDALINAALISPTAMNLQHQHFSILQSKALLTEMEQDIVKHIVDNGDPATIERIRSRNNKILYDAPTLIVISCEGGKYGGVDAGIAVQSLAIAAKGMGLDSAILGMAGLAFETEKGDYWRKTLAIPEGYNFAISIAIGYGNMPGNARELDQSKYTLIQ